MLTVNVLGHTHITHRGRVVPLSAKAVALLTYLALERLPQHREKLADLLWHTAEARKNLRVELARIRSAGLDIFPRSRQLLYLEHITTDLDVWRGRLGGGMDQGELSGWLAMLRGLPLSGMEDLGSSALQEWVDQQRCTLEEQIGEVLGQAHSRYEADGKLWATRAILARAGALGYDLGVPAAAPGPIPARPEPAPVAATPPLDEGSVVGEPERRLREVLQRARALPQVVVLHGPLGSGKSHVADSALRAAGWTPIRVRSTRMSRLVLAAIAQELARVADGADAEALQRMLLHPGNLEEDTVRLATLLARLPTPVALVLDHTQGAPVELASLLEFVLQTPSQGPRAALLLSRTPPARAPLCRALLRRFDGEQTQAIEMAPLSLRQVEGILSEHDVGGEGLGSRAAELMQRSEGNVLHLLGLLTAPAGERFGPERLPAQVRERYAGEIDGWSERLQHALGSASVINGDFDVDLMRAALGPQDLNVAAVLAEGVERGALILRDPQTPLAYPALVPAPAGDEAPEPARYLFRSEGLRVSVAAALSHERRREVRERLMHALATEEPGLALYYAERVGLGPEAERLRRAYEERLAPGHPLLARAAQVEGRAPGTVAVASPPSRPSGSPLPLSPVTWQGYTLTRGSTGALSIVSQGRSGHPGTLRLHLRLPAGLGAGPLQLRLTWKLDVFHAGADLGPLQAPFALGLGRVGDPVVGVLSPEPMREYREAGRRCVPVGPVTTGVWMAHTLVLPPTRPGPDVLELAVRAMDVALTLGTLTAGGVDLLSAGETSALRAATR